MNEHQHRLWMSMLEMIESYRKGIISYPHLVGALQGALEAAEFQDVALIERFYDFWQPLEITNAVKGNTVTYEQIKTTLEAMQNFLLEQQI